MRLILRSHSIEAVARPPRVGDAVVALLDESDRHDWSLEDITAALAARGVEADFSTVYRAVQRAVEEGSVRRLELGGSGARFEAASDDHDHIQCERCGAIDAVSASVVSQAIPEVERLTGYQVSGRQLLFRGICPRCAAD